MRRQISQTTPAPRISLRLLLVAFVFTLVSAGCGTDDQVDAGESPSTQLEATNGPALADANDPPPSDLAETAVAAADSTPDRSGLLMGAAAVDPEAVGTLVAHAVAPSVTAYERPDLGSDPIQAFANPTERGGPQVFQVVDQSGPWLEVLLPIRPNGSTGWIQADEVSLSINPFRVEIEADEYRLTIYRYGEEKLSTTIAVGNGDTPTPIGQFYLIELLRPSNPDGAYGPYAYGLSGYSDTLESFNGGEGVIGIHGTNQPEYLGQDVSHGCIRVENDVITQMTEFLPLGTPVIITRNDA